MRIFTKIELETASAAAIKRHREEAERDAALLYERKVSEAGITIASLARSWRQRGVMEEEIQRRAEERWVRAERSALGSALALLNGRDNSYVAPMISEVVIGTASRRIMVEGQVYRGLAWPTAAIVAGFCDEIERPTNGAAMTCSTCRSKPYPRYDEEHTLLDRLFEGAGNTCPFSFRDYKSWNELGVDDVALEKRCVAIVAAYERRTGIITSWDGTSQDAVRTVLEDERLCRVLEGVIADEEAGVQPSLLEVELDEKMLDLADEDEILVSDEDLLIETATRQPWPTAHEREPYGSCSEPGIPCLAHAGRSTWNDPYEFGRAVARGWRLEHDNGLAERDRSVPVALVGNPTVDLAERALRWLDKETEGGVHLVVDASTPARIARRPMAQRVDDAPRAARLVMVFGEPDERLAAMAEAKEVIVVKDGRMRRL